MMNRILSQWMAGVILFAVFGELPVVAQTASHACPGYFPGTNTTTVTCQFSYPEGGFLTGLAWFPELPAGWLIKAVSGDGGPALNPDKKSFAMLGDISSTTLNFSYTLIVPPGITTQVMFRAQAEYYLDLAPDAAYVWATTDPLVLSNLDTKTLQVVSPYGTGAPPVGIHTNPAGTALSVSMSPSWSSGPTQYVCTGWSMTGHEPASGTGTSFAMTVTNNAVLTWNWQQSNIAPGISGPYVLNAWRTSIQGANANNTISEAVLIGMASDPDGDTLSLASIAMQGSKGGSLTRDAANHTLTYMPPAHTDAVIDTFSYDVSDGKGGVATGTLSVKVGYGGTLIRAF